jgi:hypothetical protein
VGTGGADADLEEFEEAGVHRGIVGVWWMSGLRFAAGWPRWSFLCCLFWSAL